MYVVFSFFFFWWRKPKKLKKKNKKRLLHNLVLWSNIDREVAHIITKNYKKNTTMDLFDYYNCDLDMCDF